MGIEFDIGGVVIEAEFDDTETARQIIAALPLEARGNYWGDEFYFPVPVKIGCDATAREVVNVGDVVYWVEGSCLCLFWGPTPASRAGECRVASKANILGRVTNPEALRRLKAKNVTMTLTG